MTNRRKQHGPEAELLPQDVTADDLLRAISSSPDSLVYALDAGGRFIYASSALESLLGVDPGGLSGRTRETFMDVASAEQHRRNDLEVMRTGQALSTEETSLDGATLRTYLTVKSPLFGLDGAVSGVVGISTDITQRVRVEEALRESEYLFAASQSAAHVGTWSWKVGDDTVFWSDETYRIYGLSPKMGPPGFEFFFEITHPDDRQKMQEYPAAIIAGLGPSPVESRVMRADGTYCTIRTEGDVVETVDGVPSRIAGTVYDVTESKRAEEALRESEQEFRTLAEAMPQIVWVTRSDGCSTYFNQHWVEYTGMALEESYREGWSVPYHPDDRLRSQEAWALAMATGSPYEVEVRLRRADGAYRWWLIRGVPLRDADGEILKWFGTCTDIEDLKQSQTRVEQMKRLYATLSQVNQTIVRVKDAAELYGAMCDVAVEFGEFTLAWVGLHDRDSGDVRPVAATGIDVSEWPFTSVNTLDADSKDGMVASAIRSGKVIVTEDIETDERMRSVLGRMQDRDYHSIAAIPFRLRGETTGVLVLVSSVAGFFKSAEELCLLEEMGLDISFALDTMATEAERELAQDGLRASEQRFSTVFRSSGVSMALTSVNDSTFFEVNDAFCALLGFSRDEIIGRTSVELGLWMSMDQRQESSNAVSDTGHSKVFDAVLRTKSGELRHALLTTEVVSIAGVDYVLSSAQDITERILAEEQLAAQAERLRVLANVSQTFAEVVDSDIMLDRVAHKVSEVAAGICWVRLLSDDGEWLDLSALRDTDPRTQEEAYTIFSEQRQPVADSGIASKVFLSGVPILLPVVTEDHFRSMSPSQHCPLMEQFTIHSIVAAPLRVRGRSIGVLGVGRSRSDQPSFTMDDLSFVQDIADRAAMAISNAGLMQDLEEANRNLEVRVHQRTEDLEKANEAILALNEEFASTNEELAATNEELESANEDLAIINGELADTNARLDEATRAKSAFLASMSHELRTPLNSILGFSGLLAMGLAGPMNEEQALQVGMIEASGKHLLELINGLLDLSKIEAGHVQVVKEATDILPLACGVVAMMRPLGETKGLEVECECLESIGSIQTDRMRVEQILLNLLGNAVKFTDQGRVTLVVTRTESEVLFTVEDTGRGMAADDVEHVFEEFFQVADDSATSDGTGLGLTVSLGLADLLDARLSVESELGRGSRFTLHLPA